MFPWFVKVQDDHGELESIEGGSWAQVARANRDLTAPPGTAIGNHHHHKYPNARDFLLQFLYMALQLCQMRYLARDDGTAP